MICEAPRWVIKIFEFLQQDMITQEIVNEAMNWMYSKGLVTCAEII